MSIGLRKQSAASVPTPPVTEENLFIDAADDKLKKKIDTGAVIDLETPAAGVSTFEGRSGAVVSQAGDYSANEITNIPAGNIVATNVQSAINELDTEKLTVAHQGAGGVSQHPIATGADAGFMSPSDFTKLAGIAAGATANFSNGFLLSRANHTGTQTSATISDFATEVDSRIAIQKGSPSGLATLDGTSKIPITQLPASIVGGLNYQSTWNAAINSPPLASGVGTKGFYYVVSVAGSTSIDGISSWGVGDWIVFNGIQWEKVDNTDQVSSVFGRSGAVVAASGDYSASQITNAPSGSISATDVQGALNELDTEKLDVSHAGSGGSAHALVSPSLAGFMSASDKSKLDGISAGATAGITALTGEVAAIGPGSATATLSNAAVVAKLLTGLSLDWNVLSASDSILQAFAKLAGQSTLSLNTVSNDVLIPSNYTWLRQNKTIFAGTTKVTIQPGGKISFLA